MRGCRGGHAEDVFDVAWAPDASALLSGSIENVCIIWDAERGRGQSRLADHSHYVQGVAWDPARRFLVSQSADRTCRCPSLLHSDLIPALIECTTLLPLLVC
jgi:chromatin assembly factor 1 subunit B